MNSSVKSTRSAPWRAASARASRALARLPAMSPTVGLSWAMEMRRTFGAVVLMSPIYRGACSGAIGLLAGIFADRLGRMVLARRHREDAREVRVGQPGFLGP